MAGIVEIQFKFTKYLLNEKLGMMKTLEKLIEGLEVIGSVNGPDVQVSSVCYDSRRVEKGSLFVCVSGARADGHDFIHDALARGAVAIVARAEMPRGLRTGFVRVHDSRAALASIAANFYDRPASKLQLVGITGTNGKTTTSLLIESILRCAGANPGLLGTIAYRWADKQIAAPMTTPESLDLQALFYRMVQDGVSHVVMEVSSHALALGRIAGCQFKTGVFTNLSQDHLDFHATMEDYFAAKKLLFSSYLSPEVSAAVINMDDEYGGRIMANGACRAARLIPYSLQPGVRASMPIGAEAVFAENVRFSPRGITAKVHTPQGPIEVDSRLLGKLNLYNILAAICAAVSLKIAPDAIQEGISKLWRVDGRLEPVALPDRCGYHVVVDYAHTPDAMEKALSCIREMTPKRLIAVFGCGGDRDRKKRPMMGAVAARQADVVIITSDNPRSEPPEDILDQIEAGVKRAGLPLLTPSGLASASKGYLRRTDRRKAIELALEIARPGDMIFIGGKGHETYQIIGASRHPFDDRLVVRDYFEK
ncbi:MAG: UDP-N-acetylmuramoyl-L-alanyl-D-glutamate--2,6-diaminopimelate ligase [Syntrophobacteraceae bacterium]|nr:UDP-N-acetylmuramoyl-L-alanyl-D-glutamate--2,6-diaminopimelate ligase [Syntrophobacteraceae bacterium]